jgi:AcrR family transcriptional regulator
MTTPPPNSRAEQRRRTETRILDAASQAFLAAGYERTTIRAVASAAGVDAGLVMHYFGSKQELFRRVIDAAPVPEVSGAPEQAIEQILATLADRLANEPVASLTILRSMLTNTEAASVISEGMTRYQAQIAQTIPAGDASLRAALISAIILGVTVSRHLIKSDELASADPAQIISLLRPGMISLAAQPPAPLADVGRQVLIGRDQIVPPRLGVAALTPGEVGGEIFGVDLPPGPVEGDRVQGHAPDLDD